jgi:hypothetical protein
LTVVVGLFESISTTMLFRLESEKLKSAPPVPATMIRPLGEIGSELVYSK